MSPPLDNPAGDLREDENFFLLLKESYAKRVGVELASADRSASWLYHHAPFAVVAHNTHSDPCFIYANRAAQECFGYSWEEFVALRSRYSAEPENRAERDRMLEVVTRTGVVLDYSGERIAKSGRRFWIRNGVIWQLEDAAGLHGQAAAFTSWLDV